MKSSQMDQLVDQVSQLFDKTEYPELVLKRVEECIKNSRVLQGEKDHMLKMARGYVVEFVKQRDHGPSPDEKRRSEEMKKRLQKMDARRLEEAREIRRKLKLEEYKKAHKYD